MGRVENPKARKHQPVPQNPLDMNTILDISPALIESDQGLSQSQFIMLPRPCLLCKRSFLRNTNYTKNFSLSPGETPNYCCLVVLEN